MQREISLHVIQGLHGGRPADSRPGRSNEWMYMLGEKVTDEMSQNERMHVYEMLNNTGLLNS